MNGMIHYSCDCCKRMIDSDDLRFVVKMEVFVAIDPEAASHADDDRDHLQELQDILQRADEIGELDAAPECEQLRYDLCPECHKKFLKNPLGREASKQFDFSKN